MLDICVRLRNLRMRWQGRIGGVNDYVNGGVDGATSIEHRVSSIGPLPYPRSSAFAGLRRTGLRFHPRLLRCLCVRLLFFSYLYY